MKNLLLFSAIALTFCISSYGQTDKDTAKSQKAVKITAEELVSKHLASIGSDEDVAAAKSRIMIGVGRLGSKLGFAGQIGGPAQFASEGDKIVFAMIFNANDYPYEKAGFDGQHVTVGKPGSGDRSLLGDFLKSQNTIFKQGLFGGVLSSAWSLANAGEKKSKLQYAGIEKNNNRQLYKLKYVPTRGGNLKINLFFDAETFQHVSSQYEYVVPPSIGPTRTDNANQKESRYILTETFADYRTEGRLTLPHIYTINLTINTEDTKSLEWTIKFSQFVFNQPIDIQAFKVS